MLRPGFGVGEERELGVRHAFGKDFVFEVPRTGHAELIENYGFCKLRFLGADGREGGEHVVVVTLELGPLTRVDGILLLQSP